MRFKIGDYVETVKSLWSWEIDGNERKVPVGTVLKVVGDSPHTDFYCNPKDMTIEIEGLDLESARKYFKLAEPPTTSIARPILTERKNDKVMIQLVDDGFPNALWELAKLMSWANNKKGYLPHDWKNLPNAEIEFSAAASRHRMKPKLGEKYDPESNLLHKAHEAFNVLAELELMLIGKINI